MYYLVDTKRNVVYTLPTSILTQDEFGMYSPNKKMTLTLDDESVVEVKYLAFLISNHLERIDYINSLSGDVINLNDVCMDMDTSSFNINTYDGIILAINEAGEMHTYRLTSDRDTGVRPTIQAFIDDSDYTLRGERGNTTVGAEGRILTAVYDADNISGILMSKLYAKMFSINRCVAYSINGINDLSNVLTITDTDKEELTNARHKVL